MIRNINKRPACRFNIWCTIYTFFFSILIFSAPMNYAQSLQKTGPNRSIADMINCLMDLFASEAAATDSTIAAEIKKDLAPVGDIKINEHVGSFSCSYPIEIPTGRAGLTPNLSLIYSSGGQNGWIGVGWDLTESWIERDTKLGEPDYADTDTFSMKFMGSTVEIVKESTGQYRAKHENVFQKIVKSSDTWVVTSKNGIKYYFGTTSDSKLINPNHGTFRWYLSSIEDLNGNETNYTYYNDTTNNEVYLTQIAYPVDYYVVFVPDPDGRTDSHSVWKNYFKQEMIDRLKEIQIYHGSPLYETNLVRAYQMNYTYSEGSFRSILSSIQEYGKGSTIGGSGIITSGPSLPATQFEIYQASNNFDDPHTWTTSAISVKDNDYKYKVRIGDFNGDGKMDMLYYSASSQVMVMLSNGSGFSAPTPWYSSSITVNDWERQYWVDDFNGDGKSDVMYNDASGIYWVMLSNSNGDGFNIPANWHAPVSKCLSDGFSDSMDYLDPNHGSLVADFNHDGMADVFYRDLDGCDYMVMLSNGVDGFGTPQQWYDYPGTTDNSSVSNIADYNGDGKIDLEFQEVDPTAWASTWFLYEWITYNSSSDFNVSYEVYRNWYANCLAIQSGDFDGDRKRELLLQNVVSDNTVSVAKLGDCKTIFSNLVWTGWRSNVDLFSGITSYTNNDGYWVVDVNGDGRDDVLYVSGSGGTPEYYKVMLSKGDSFAVPVPWSPFYGSLGSKIMIGDFTGDGQVDIAYVESNQVKVIKNNAQRDLIKKVTNSLGATSEIGYIPSSEWSNIYLPFKVQTVSAITTNDGNGHSRTQTYSYSGGYYDVSEREFRGFSDVTMTDDSTATGLFTQSHYFQDNVFDGRLSSSETTDRYGAKVSYTENSWQAVILVNDAISGSAFTPSDLASISEAANYRTFTYISSNAINNFKPSDSINPYSTITTINSGLDNFGNFALIHKYTNDSTPVHQYIRTVYNNNLSYWILGQPANIRIGTTDPGNTGSHALRETKFLYYTSNPNKPWLLQYKKQVNWVTADGLLGSPLEYTSAYEYDVYGNLTHEKDPVAYSSNPTYYSKIITYDTNGMFPTQITNALNQSAAMTYEPDFGKILSETDANLQTTTFYYDEFGRTGGSPAGHHDIEYPDGSYKDYTYNIAAGNNYTIVEASGQPYVKTYYDNFGRKWKEDTVATDGTTIRKVTLYDNAGRVEQTSLPYYLNETSYWTLYHYDSARGYLDRQTNPDTTFKSFTNDGFIETATDENNHTKTTVKDSLDRIIQITEATGGITYYNYDIFNNLLNVTDPLGALTTITYDDLSRKITMNDPYMGLWKYGYDQNGNLVTQTDAKNNLTSMEYDEGNRITNKDYEYDNVQVVFDYDEQRTNSDGNSYCGSYYCNTGDLTSVTTSDGTVIDFNYDKMGRKANEKRIISSTIYYTDWHYDSAGRIDYIKYPDTNHTRYNYAYYPIGALKEVRQNGAQYPLADFVEYNALGQIGSVSYKNGASTEYFYYDDGSCRLKDLISSDKNGTIQDLHYEFDDAGNVTFITDNQNYITHSLTYDEINRLKTADAPSSDPLRQYSQAFNYDLSGNITSKTGLGGYTVQTWKDPVKHIRPATINFNSTIDGLGARTIVNNQDNKPIQISYNGTTTNLYYDGEGDRVKKVQGANTVIYVGEIYEVRGSQALSYIYANGKKVVTLTGTYEYYTHPDHLGSTSLTTDKDGNAVEEIGYLPFGALLFRKTYNGGGWSSDYRYTGQELDPEYELYNYNARLYDPVMGRFISPDTIIPEPFNPQSLNRYAYCLNNPLRYTDPSGHQNEDDEYTLEEITVTAPRQDNSYWWLVGWGGTVIDGVLQQTPSTFLNTFTQTYGEYVGYSARGGAVGLFLGIVFSSSETSADSDLTAEEKAEYDKKEKEEKAKDSLETDKAKDVRENIKDKESNPENWEEINKNEKSIETGRYKGQTNIEREYTNKNTGDKVYEHEIKNSNGKTTHGPHYRGYPK